MKSVVAAGRDGRRWIRPGSLIAAAAVGLAGLAACDGGTPAGAMAVAAEPAQSAGAPTLPGQLSGVVVAEPDRIDMGDIPAKLMTEHEVKLHNRGTKPLVFTRATTSCGCTTAEVESREIQPGDFAVVKVKWTASEHNAPKSTKTVYVFADGYGAPVQIPVSAAVVGGTDAGTPPQISPAPAVLPMSVEIEPKELDFGFIKPEAVATGVLTIRNTGGTPLELARVTSNCSCAVGKLAKSTLEPGESTTVDVEMTAGPNIGVLAREVQVWGKDNPQPLRVAVKANVSYDVNADPMFINMLGARSGEIKLMSVDGQAFRVLSAHNKAPELTGGDANAPATEHTLRWDMTGTPDAELPRFFVIATDHPGMPLLDLRVIHPSLFPQSGKPDPWTPTLDRLVLGRIDASTAWTREIQLVKLAKDVPVKVESPDGLFKGEILEQRMEQRGLMVKLRVTPAMDKIGAMNGNMPAILHGKLTLTTEDPAHSFPLEVYATMAQGAGR